MVAAPKSAAAATPQVPANTQPAAAGAAKQVVPTAVHIPALNVSSSLIPLLLNPDGTVQVPDVHNPAQAGWYALDAVPGDVGAAVLLGHVDGDGKLGVFHDIGRLNLGDTITVDRSDGATATFSVTKVQTIPKTDFPSEQVYGPTPDSELRLVTCGGQLDTQAHNYLSSVIVYAKKV